MLRWVHSEAGLYVAVCVIAGILLMVAAWCERIRSAATRTTIAAATAIVPVACILCDLVFFDLNGSMAIQYLSLAFVMTSVPALLRLVRLSSTGYAAMFGIFLFYHRYVGPHEGTYERILFLCTGFAAVAALSAICLRGLRGRVYAVWLTFALTVADGYLFERLLNDAVRSIGYAAGSPSGKVLVWGIAVACAVAFNTAAVWLLKRAFRRQLRELSDMGARNPILERRFGVATAGLLCLTVAANALLVRLGRTAATEALFLAYIAICVLQLLYLTLLYRLTCIREDLSRKEQENERLALYSARLAQSYDGMRGIRHDIKNLFMTMGHFVARSGDAEMAAFYAQRIAPYVSDELKRADLHGKLLRIRSEPLKAFLYYKASQALERGVDVAFAVEMDEAGEDVGMAFADLIRILGIWIDNAIEESERLEGGWIEVRVARNGQAASFTVENRVTRETREAGIRRGMSTKGADRGQGLQIVRDIAGRYGNVVVNSYFREDAFAQNLCAYLTNDG